MEGFNELPERWHGASKVAFDGSIGILPELYRGVVTEGLRRVSETMPRQTFGGLAARLRERVPQTFSRQRLEEGRRSVEKWGSSVRA